MIAHFALMGDLYQYDPYETEASLWNSYPWQIGLENNIDISAALPESNMSKMIWELGDSDSAIGSTSVVLGNFGMFAVLILLDNFGNLGADAGSIPKPDPLPFKLISLLSGSVISVGSVSKLIQADANSERKDEPVKPIALLSGTVISVNSELKLIQADANSERKDEPVKPIALMSGTVISISSVIP